MQANEEHWESDEEFLARLAARRAKKRAEKLAAEEAAKPKLTMTVSPKVVEAVKADPAGVRIAVKAADETMVVERVRPLEAFEVLEVDLVTGRPKLCRRHDLVTNEWGVVEFSGGYCPAGGAVHEYNPLDGLKRRGE
jgi:hypothetical protein